MKVKESLYQSFRLAAVLGSLDSNGEGKDIYTRSIPMLHSYLLLLEQNEYQIFTGPVIELELNNELPIIPQAWNFIFYDFAMHLMNFHQTQNDVSPDVISEAKNQKDMIYINYGPNLASVFPSTLPMGSGNSDGYNYAESNYYPSCEPDIYPNGECYGDDDDDCIETEGNTDLTL